MHPPIRKAVFPVAGLGTRFLPATKAMPKEMLTVVDRPLIQYVVDEAREAGIEHFIFVTGRNKGVIEDHFDIQVELDRERLSVTVEDEGLPFNPFARSAPDTTLSLEEREIGGLGIHLVRKMMDEVSYVRRTGRNVVNVVKHIVDDEAPSNEEKLN